MYLLDDPLSAVDAHVGKDIFFGCILGGLRRRGKTVVLATQQVQYLPYADKILILNKKGQQSFFGSYEDLVERPNVMSIMSLTPSTRIELTKEFEDCENEDKQGDGREEYLEEIPTTTGEILSRVSALIDGGLKRHKIVEEEDRVVGCVTTETYSSYLRFGGVAFGIGAAFQLLAAQVVTMMSDYWLRWWASAAFGPQNSPRYMYIYGILVFLCILLGYLRARSWYEFCLIASSSLHDSSLWSILHSPLQYFVANPTGRILNRFTKDLSSLDTILPDVSLDFLQIFLFCMGALVLIVIAVPWMLIMVPFLLIGFIWVRRKYMLSARELKRLDGVTKSPILIDLSAAVEGLSTLRAYGLKERITGAFHQQLDINGRVWFSLLIANRWLGLRLDVGVYIVITATVYLSCFLRDHVDVGLLGFALVYALSVTALFQWCIRQSAEVENHMTSVERLLSFARLPAEHGYKYDYSLFQKEQMSDLQVERLKYSRNCFRKDNLSKQTLRYNLSEKTLNRSSNFLDELNMEGSIEIINLTVKYRADLDPVLKRVSLSIPGGRKVGVCGRTGSGKSSLLLSILRMNLITEGDVIVDGKSLLSMDLDTVRSMISIIPQDAHLFSGTVRYNLDPFSLYTDEELWSALESAHIKSTIASTKHGLSHVVSEAGNNFSTGQRQLISLARCILRRSKIVLMDEVTSSIDYQLDGLIQDTIRRSNALKNATIITVAHRLRTIADADLIVVIDCGSVVEVGEPQNLLETESSFFKSLAEKSGEIEELHRIASLRK